MGDFPAEWLWVRDLSEGGQAHTFIVRRSDGSDSKLYVLKRLKNPRRQDYFEREIRACQTLDHPNILRVLEHGQTPKGKHFLITEYCEDGSLEGKPKFDKPADGLRFFEQIVSGMAYAHQQGVFHLDLKPPNILLKAGVPIVGDFGICFIESGEVSLTAEGPRGSMYYCAPELRNPRIIGSPRPAAADVYSLGKVLYWLFTNDVYDGHEEEYQSETSRHLARLFTAYPQFAFIDELVHLMVRRNPAERIANATDLHALVKQGVERIEAGGRVLDIRIPQRCLYCAVGHYRPAHDQVGRVTPQTKFPEIELRKNPPTRRISEPDPYEPMRVAAELMFGSRLAPSQPSGSPAAPLCLVCDYCGNVQYFRFDLTSRHFGENWRP